MERIYAPHNPTRVWNVEQSRLEVLRAVPALPPIQFIRPVRRLRLFGLSFRRFA